MYSLTSIILAYPWLKLAITMRPVSLEQPTKPEQICLIKSKGNIIFMMER